MDQESWMNEVKENATFRGEVRQFIRQSPDTMKSAAETAVAAHNDDKEAHPKQRLSFVLSVAALGASIFAPAAYERLKSYLEHPGQANPTTLGQSRK